MNGSNGGGGDCGGVGVGDGGGGGDADRNSDGCDAVIVVVVGGVTMMVYIWVSRSPIPKEKSSTPLCCHSSLDLFPSGFPLPDSVLLL